MTFGFTTTALDRLTDCLSRLLPHVQLECVAITGGVAIEFALARHGAPGQRSEIADLDLVATSVEGVRPGVLAQFLLSHYHVAQPGVPKFMIQLVDPVSGIRVDVFPDLVGSIAESSEISLGPHCVRMLSAQRIFEHKLGTLSRASPAKPIDPKHVRDAFALADLLQSHADVPVVAADALAPDVYGGEADASCLRCQLSTHADWPLAPKEQIFETLGWQLFGRLR